MSATIENEPDLNKPMHRAIFWRGVFVHRYAGIEHSVTELILRSGARDEYRELGGVPFTWARKLARLTQLLDRPGPLTWYSEAVREALIPLTGVKQHRHLLVHGMMSLDPLGNQPDLLYFKTHAHRERDLGEVTLWMTIDELITMVQGMQPFVRAFTALLVRIFDEIPLVPIDVAPRTEMEIDVRRF